MLQLDISYSMPLVDIIVMHQWKLSDTEGGFMFYRSSALGFENAMNEPR